MKRTALKLIVILFVFILFLPNEVYGSDRIIQMDGIKSKLQMKIVNGIPYVPIRAALEAMGWTVKWETGRKMIFCTKKKDLVVFQIGSKKVSFNKKELNTDYPPFLSNNKAYIQSTFIAQRFGVKIKWEKGQNLIVVSDESQGSITVNGKNNLIILGSGIIANIYEPYDTGTIKDMASYADRLLCAGNAEDSLNSYKEILDNINEKDKNLYAHIVKSMADAYCLSAESKDAKINLQNAEKLYEKVLKLYKSMNDSYHCAVTLSNLARTRRIISEMCNQSDKTKLAIAEDKESLGYYTVKGSSIDLGLVYLNMGLAYKQAGSESEQKSCLGKAEKFFLEALKTNTMKESRELYAMLQYNLGTIYLLYPEPSDKRKVLDQSMSAFRETLKVWTLESSVLNYARVHTMLGDAYRKRFEDMFEEAELTNAVKEYTNALEVLSIKRYPIDYAGTNGRIGNAYARLAELKKTPEFLKKAQIAYNEALKVFDPLNYPVDNKTISAGLAKVKNLLIMEERK